VRHGKHRRGPAPSVEVAAQLRDQPFGQGLHVVTPMLAVGRGHSHRRRIGVEVECRRRETAQLSGAQTGRYGQGVEHRPIRPGHSQANGRNADRFEQRQQLVRFKRPGMKWDTDNAAALMNLVALREGGQWELYWQNRKTA